MEIARELVLPEIDQRVETLKSLLPENAEIVVKNGTRYEVETRLNGDFCDGGQKVKLDLSFKSEFKNPWNLPTGYINHI